MDALLQHLLRPYRSQYALRDLGPKRNPSHERSDDSLINPRGQRVVYSYYRNRTASSICVIYCHCNSGSRVEAVQMAGEWTACGWNACLFDFSGSGLSEGDYVSLGHHECEDLDSMVREVKRLGNKKILLWGRSMGAATIINYLGQNKYREGIVACVLDSPYSSLCGLIKRVAADVSGLPSFLIATVLSYARDSILADYGFDLQHLEPVKHISQLDMPLMLITSLADTFVLSQEVEELYKAAGSKRKVLEYIDKAHNASRDSGTIQVAMDFMKQSLEDRVKLKKQLRIFMKNNVDVTGSNMAEMILKVEQHKHKDSIHRTKSQVNLPGKENLSSLHNYKHQLKTEQTQTHQPLHNFKHQLKTEQTQHPLSKDSVAMHSKSKVELPRRIEQRTIKIHARIV